MKKIVVVALVSLATLGASGCVLAGPGNTQIKQGNAVVGEMHALSGGVSGYLVTFYAGPTTAIKALHDGKISLKNNYGTLIHCGGSTTDVCTLRWLHTFQGSAEWHRATADDEAGDFHSAITGMPHPGFDCVAVQINTFGGENWTYRHASDSSCTP
jgi:hypothetical protein